MTRNSASGSSSVRYDKADRAVIDIGSNTVRLVVYSGTRRTPDVWLNEKVTAKLGRDLEATGKLPDKAMDMALSSLARFAAILRDLEIRDVQCVATAAVRDAKNGAAFLDKVRALGLEPRLLSGEEEANIAAMGVIGAFPGARGVVADLGGGSLELVAIGDGTCHDGISLPLGTLRLGPMREQGEREFRKAVAKELSAAAWAKGQAGEQAGPLYLVGGTWRALASFAMHRTKYPLTDPHAFRLSREDAEKVAKKLAKMNPDQLTSIDGISSSRAAGLPDAAAMLRVILSTLKPEGLVVSGWGLREGLLFDRLEQAARDQDPLLAAVTHFTAPRGASLPHATMIAGWTAKVVTPNGGGTERLRLAAIMLAQAQRRLEPNMRLKHSFDWAMDKRWLGLEHRERALIGAALRGACNRPEPTPELLQLASEDALREAAGWGLAFRLCRRIGAGSRTSMLTSHLSREDGQLTLWLDKSRAELASEHVVSDLKALADWLGCAPDLRISEDRDSSD
ncbi:Ppx/GppA family phosphatase [Alteraurantiacibacter aquimixticola]|uniref:Ppx/GppA family phosphatase n=1 Tax=Alteraurantiacibacter aquimixticola TaxID=2489173 RepID=A0A4V6UGA4_9SPHN|nr:Ppx/GppA family phosphatase [Alteraurantiacibacter aquimixticola]TIX49610.1 Ppx/GppA family phosphatase [Alteraurantiacibacter aquimixticola]